MLHETEAEAVTIRGQIECTEPLHAITFSGNLKGDIRHDDSNGVKIAIGKVTCTAVTSGSFVVGDTVEVKYLPRSRDVLSMTCTMGDQ